MVLFLFCQKWRSSPYTCISSRQIRFKCDDGRVAIVPQITTAQSLPTPSSESWTSFCRPDWPSSSYRNYRKQERSVERYDTSKARCGRPNSSKSSKGVQLARTLRTAKHGFLQLLEPSSSPLSMPTLSLWTILTPTALFRATFKTRITCLIWIIQKFSCFLSAK